ncbi:uncharacterized protein LOC120170610 [Hibiscus syriacus]|uniref:uncharacterized protein LOC120170610 n=1 Tax=Hibiscus syriacus TaxID=106335 RepID=UPI001922E519|nr:uncharacterized protein LOC120170610 [Hibiscus syriacus]
MGGKKILPYTIGDQLLLLERGRCSRDHGWSYRKLLKHGGTAGVPLKSTGWSGEQLVLLEATGTLLWWSYRRGGTPGAPLEIVGTVEWSATWRWLLSRLQDLKTLDLRGCRNLINLTSKTSRLVSLEHLQVDGCDKLAYMPPGLGNLSCLQELCVFVLVKTTKKRCWSTKKLKWAEQT